MKSAGHSSSWAVSSLGYPSVPHEATEESSHTSNTSDSAVGGPVLDDRQVVDGGR